MQPGKNCRSPKKEAISPLAPKTGMIDLYLREINAIPILKEAEEYTLAKSWIKNNDMRAAHKLVTAHLRLVAKIAAGYRGYGLPYEELVSEGTIGMMHAVKRFDPDRGSRLSTYASWWIKASIQEYVLRNWSLVKIGTTRSQKKLFFNLRSSKENMGAISSGDLKQEHLKQISCDLNVPQKDVQMMNRRMIGNGDLSLNSTINNNGEERQWQDCLKSNTPTPETQIVERQEIQVRRKMLADAFKHLNPREASILSARRLQNKPITLDILSKKYNISRERVRQIENRAFQKIQTSMQKQLRLSAPKNSLAKNG